MEEQKQPPQVQVSAREFDEYRQSAQKRRQARRQALALRLQRAWEVARQAADLLKSEYAVDRVMAYGSLVHPQLFHERSDIDLAVWGMDERLYYRALGELLNLAPQFSIDLVEFEFARSGLQDRIEGEGVEL